MKTSLSAAVLGAMIGALSVAIYVMPTAESSPRATVPGRIPVAHQPSSPPSEEPMVSTLVVKMPPAVLAPAGSVAVTDDPNHDERVQQRVDELMALAMNDDAKSLDTIWAEVFNADKEIRFGAVEALMQFGDHSMAPRLRQLAASTVDPAEKAHIIAAADFLSLPRLGEANGTTSTPQSP